MRNPFRYFKTSPEIIRLAVMLYVSFPLSLRNVENSLQELSIDISHETVRFWEHRFGPIFSSNILRKRTMQRFQQMKSLPLFANIAPDSKNFLMGAR